MATRAMPCPNFFTFNHHNRRQLKKLLQEDSNFSLHLYPEDQA